MKNVLLILVLLFAVACGGAKDASKDEKMTDEVKEQPTEMVESTAADAMPNDGTRQVGDITKCPVSGNVFTIAATSPTAEVEGKTYYLCCDGCVKSFEEDPAKYLSGNAPEHKHENHEEHHKADGETN